MSLPRRIARALGAAALLTTSGAVATACVGGGASSLGHRACLDVASSIRRYAAASHSPGAAAARDRAAALTLIQRAVPLAALAASSDGTWQALGATLSESSRVPESDLLPALRAECAQTLGTGG
ncbi:MAG: hypothetical protein M0Z33_07425 [Actinomycetota bacterium]|nr:hypothetical protein [Actinomycetota bacterium]